MKVQGIAVPFAAEIVLTGKRVDLFLRQRFCLRDRQRMGLHKLDIGHAVSSPPLRSRSSLSTSFAVHEVTGCPGEHCRTHTEHYSSKQGTARCRCDAGCSPLPRTDRQVGFDGRERAVTTVARRLMQIARLRALSSRCFLDHVALLSAPEHRPYAAAALLCAIKVPIPSHRSHSLMELLRAAKLYPGLKGTGPLGPGAQGYASIHSNGPRNAVMKSRE